MHQIQIKKLNDLILFQNFHCFAILTEMKSPPMKFTKVFLFIITITIIMAIKATIAN